MRNPGRHLPVSPSYTTGRAPEPALRKEQNLRAGAGREDLRGLWPSVERGVPVVAERGVPAYRYLVVFLIFGCETPPTTACGLHSRPAHLYQPGRTAPGLHVRSEVTCLKDSRASCTRG